MMNLESLANLGEVIGAVAVVVSLIYLAVQIRQSTESQRTENYARALDRLSAMQSLLSQDDELSQLFAKGVHDVSVLAPQERIQFTWSMYEAFGAFEFLFHAAQSRSVPEEVWDRWSSAVAWWLAFAGVRTWWANRPISFTKSFTAYVDATIANNPTDEDAVQRWMNYVATSHS